jgi:hypothetical protein
MAAVDTTVGSEARGTQPIIKEDGHDQRNTAHRLWIVVWTDLLQPIDQLRRTPCKRFKVTTLPRIAI